LAIVYIHLYYKNYKYTFKEKEFVIEYGIIFKTRVIIPYQKIQNVNIYYDPLHKLLGTAKVIINTAATDVTLSEYVLEAIDYPDELVRYIMDKVEGNKHYKRRLAE
jgi:membrane protein YdbS with pleckstrin-like domain